MAMLNNKMVFAMICHDFPWFVMIHSSVFCCWYPKHFLGRASEGIWKHDFDGQLIGEVSIFGCWIMANQYPDLKSGEIPHFNPVYARISQKSKCFVDVNLLKADNFLYIEIML